MNDYKVIATGIYGEHTVTAIDEKDARREFRARHKGENVGEPPFIGGFCRAPGAARRCGDPQLQLRV